jgi:uncharacterized protein YjcR
MPKMGGNNPPRQMGGAPDNHRKQVTKPFFQTYLEKKTQERAQKQWEEDHKSPYERSVDRLAEEIRKERAAEPSPSVPVIRNTPEEEAKQRLGKQV